MKGKQIKVYNNCHIEIYQKNYLTEIQTYINWKLNDVIIIN